MNYQNYSQKKNTKLNIIFSIISFFVCVVLVFITGVMFYCNTFLSYYPIDGDSMQPLLNAEGNGGDFVYATKNSDGITYSTVMIYFKEKDMTSPYQQDHKDRNVIKRVIAMAGDNVMIKSTGVRVEGTADDYYAIFIQYGGQGEFVELVEDYIQDKTVYRNMYNQFYISGRLDHKPFSYDDNGNRYLHIEDDEIFFLGDNRLDSWDCLDYGAQKIDPIVGKVEYIIYKGQNRVWQVIAQMLGFLKWK